MKNFQSFLILICMMSMLYVSCEESKVHGDLLSGPEIKYREIDDCEDCPQQHCCCSIELQENSPLANLELCGVYTNETVSTPCGPFTPPSPCASFSGSKSPMTLDPAGDGRKLFCLEFGETFRVVNNNSIEAVRLKVSCRASDTAPTYLFFQLNPAEEIFFTEVGECDLEECS
jgi:hypothetical protein